MHPDCEFLGRMREAVKKAHDDLHWHAYEQIKKAIVEACRQSNYDFYSLAYLHGFVKKGAGVHTDPVDDYPEIMEAVFWHDRLFGWPDCAFDERGWLPEGLDDAKPTKEAKAALRRGKVEVIGKVFGLAMPMRPKRKGDHEYPSKGVEDWVVARTMTDDDEAEYMQILEDRLMEIDCELQSFGMATGCRAHYHVEIIGSAPDAAVVALLDKAAVDAGYYRDPKPSKAAQT